MSIKANLLKIQKIQQGLQKTLVRADLIRAVYAKTNIITHKQIKSLNKITDKIGKTYKTTKEIANYISTLSAKLSAKQKEIIEREFYILNPQIPKLLGQLTKTWNRQLSNLNKLLQSGNLKIYTLRKTGRKKKRIMNIRDLDYTQIQEVNTTGKSSWIIRIRWVPTRISQNIFDTKGNIWWWPENGKKAYVWENLDFNTFIGLLLYSVPYQGIGKKAWHTYALLGKGARASVSTLSKQFTRKNAAIQAKLRKSLGLWKKSI